MPLDAARKIKTGSGDGFVAWRSEDLERNIAHHFERWAGEHPDRVAVSWAGRDLRYGELNRMANVMARLIQKTGTAAGRPVVLLLEHGTMMIAAILGVLKSGRICVFLDLSFPEARAAAIMADSQAAIVVTEAAHLNQARRLCPGDATLIVVGDEDWAQPAENPCLSLPPESFATIVYTSGSTGRPKGVIQTHGNSLRHVRAWTNGLGIEQRDRIAMLASPSVGQGMNTILAALLNGASLHPFDLRNRGLGALGEWLAREGITVVITTPTVLRNLAALIGPGPDFPDLRLVVLGGETLKWSDVEAGRAVFASHCVFANTFSGTETGNVTQYVIGAGESAGEGDVPVGYVVEDLKILLLGEDGAEVGKGDRGEIAVVSRYLSPGYWGNEEQTRAVFGVHEPSGARMYRTGDLGRISGEERLEHLGRKDFQVKIRGYRVELEEVEGALRDLTGVREAALVCEADEHGEKRLRAYVVPAQGADVLVAQLRRQLRERLPSHMVPGEWILVESLPLTPMGKLDRQALSSLRKFQAPKPAESAFAGPRNEIEGQVAGIWAEELGVGHVGIHENFFEHGGQSLTVARVVARVRTSLGVDLPFEAVFESPTVAGLCATIERLRAAGATAGLPGPHPMPRDQPMEASFAQERIWRYSRTPEGAAGYTRFSIDRFRGPLDVIALQSSLDHLVRRHEILRTSFAETDGRLLQIIHPAAPLNLPVIDLRTAVDPVEQAAAEQEKERTIAFNLGTGPLFRVKLLRIREDEHWLIRTSHYIMADGGSWRIFFDELVQLYEAYQRGETPALPTEAALQYGDFAVWQRECFRPGSPEHAAEIAWWKRELQGGLPQPAPRFRRPVPQPDAPAAEGRIAWGLTPGISQELDRLGWKAGATYYMTRLALFSAQLASESAHPDVMLGMYATNRLRAEVQDMLGCFINLVTLRLRFNARLTFKQWLSQVSKVVIESQMHSGIPYERLAGALRREGVHPPGIQIIFGSSDQRPPLRAGALEIDTVPPSTKGGASMPWGFSVSLEPMNETHSWLTSFDARIYDPQAVRAFTDRTQQLAGAVSREPDRPLDELMKSICSNSC